MNQLPVRIRMGADPSTARIDLAGISDVQQMIPITNVSVSDLCIGTPAQISLTIDVDSIDIEGVADLREGGTSDGTSLSLVCWRPMTERVKCKGTVLVITEFNTIVVMPAAQLREIQAKLDTLDNLMCTSHLLWAEIRSPMLSEPGDQPQQRALD